LITRIKGCGKSLTAVVRASSEHEPIQQLPKAESAAQVVEMIHLDFRVHSFCGWELVATTFSLLAQVKLPAIPKAGAVEPKNDFGVYPKVLARLNDVC